jgi:hypothetical protein
MYKTFLLVTFLFIFSSLLSAQDIRYFFKILSVSIYTDELDAKARDSLLQGKDFYPAHNDSEEIVVYKLAVLDTQKNFLRIEASFESGQAGYWTMELRSFKTKTGNSIVIFSAVGGAHNMFSQNEFIVYTYKKTKGLVQTNNLGLIPDVSIKNFVKPGTPASIIKKYDSYSSVAYELGYEEENITLRLSEDFDLGKLDKKWLLGDAIEFLWAGDHFIRRKPGFKH